MKTTVPTSTLEEYFSPFREKIVGINSTFRSPYGTKKIVYADWIASGRLYQPIEDRLSKDFGPFLGNTHTETTATGKTMTLAYHQAHQIIKKHVNANQDDVIITTGSGMTGVMAKFQRILGLRCPESIPIQEIPENERAVVFITHMEHHSNHTPWLESLAEVVIIPPCDQLLVNPEALIPLIEKYKDRKLKIGSFSACSNVTGIIPDYYRLAEIMHQYGGYAFVDFAASAPYVEINMHPQNPKQSLDAIFFSPHKFLGGPGSSGVVVFNKALYRNRIPDHPGGGTVTWTNPWGGHAYFDDIEIREDGGTPAFMQTIRAALAIRLKETMDPAKMLEREHELLEIAFDGLRKIEHLEILADNVTDRLGVISFYVKGIHHNLMVRLLNDKFGIQVRGGCSCAGTYGHFLLNVDEETSRQITCSIDQGDFSQKPGWVRLSLHPTMTNEELLFIIEAIGETVSNVRDWGKEYEYNPKTNEFEHKTFKDPTSQMLTNWFEVN